MKLLSLSHIPLSSIVLYSVNSGPSVVTWQCPAPAIVIGSATTDGGRTWDDMMTVAVASRMGEHHVVADQVRVGTISNLQEMRQGCRIWAI